MSDPLQDLEATPAVSPTASHRLFQAGIAVLVATLAYSYWSTGGDISLAQLMALGTIGLASLPALQWAKHRRTWFPAFEISLLSCIAFYAMPLFKGTDELAAYDASSRTQASLLVLIYTACANFGFAGVRRQGRPARWATETLLPASSFRWIPVGMFLIMLFAYVSVYFNVIPVDIEGTLRALFFGVGIMATFVLARLWGVGKLSAQQVIFF
ncbi:MAG: hypothetical protein ACHQ4G_08230, partial [Opitutales bacterium]